MGAYPSYLRAGGLAGGKREILAVVVGDGGRTKPPSPAYPGQVEGTCREWAGADCEEIRTPWLALSGPRTVFILNVNFFSLATSACVGFTACEDDENRLARLYRE